MRVSGSTIYIEEADIISMVTPFLNTAVCEGLPIGSLITGIHVLQGQGPDRLQWCGPFEIKVLTSDERPIPVGTWHKQRRWRPKPGEELTVYGAGPSRASAEGEALKNAIEAGWTPARWWQWWRWGENR